MRGASLELSIMQISVSHNKPWHIADPDPEPMPHPFKTERIGNMLRCSISSQSRRTTIRSKQRLSFKNPRSIPIELLGNFTGLPSRKAKGLGL